MNGFTSVYFSFITTEAREPWLQILPAGEQAVAAHRAVAKAEIALDT
jgi:hypothetical protein